MHRSYPLSLAASIVVCVLAVPVSAPAAIVTFFNESLSATTDSSKTNSDTIRTGGYLFTYSLDKLFTGGVGLTIPIGRSEVVQWPDGIHAQGITTGPNAGKAYIEISRVDGSVFDISALTFKLISSTAGAGADLEFSPILNDSDGPQVNLDATGPSGYSISYSNTQSDYRGYNTSSLAGYDTYKMTLYADFALTSITLQGADVAIPEPSHYTLWASTFAAIVFAFRRRRRDRKESKMGQANDSCFQVRLSGR